MEAALSVRLACMRHSTPAHAAIWVTYLTELRPNAGPSDDLADFRGRGDGDGATLLVAAVFLSRLQGWTNTFHSENSSLAIQT